MDMELRKEVKSLVRDFVHKYLDVSDDVEDIMAEYALRTWRKPSDQVKYLHIVGDVGMGKTRAGKVMQAICRKALFTTQFSTASTALEMLDSEHSKHPLTLIFDDVNLNKQREFETILRSGSMSNLRVGKIVRTNEGLVPKFYNVFGYKIILTNLGDRSKILRDPTFLSKCITVHMSKLAQVDVPRILDESDFAKDSSTVGRALYALALGAW